MLDSRESLADDPAVLGNAEVGDRLVVEGEGRGSRPGGAERSSRWRRKERAVASAYVFRRGHGGED